MQLRLAAPHPPPPSLALCTRLRAQLVRAAACSLQDKVDAACFGLRQRLALGDPGNERLLAAAAAHVRTLQRQKRAEAAAQMGMGLRAEGLAAAERQAAAAGTEAEAAARPASPAVMAGPASNMPAGGSEQQPPPASGAATCERPQQEHHLVAALREAAATTPPAASALGQRLSQPAEGMLATASKQHQQERRAAHLAHLARQHLARLLPAALQLRLPATPPAGMSGWVGLQEAAARLSALAARCTAVMEAQDAAPLAAAVVAGRGDAEALAAAVAARCTAALQSS